MHRSATSKKRAGEAKKELDMDEKEATPVEDIEAVLPPAEPTKPAQREEQLDRHIQTEKERFQETMMELKEGLKDNNKNIESVNQKIDDIKKKLRKNFKGELNKNIESLKEDSQKLSQQITENNKKMEAVSYTHLDVYKRQLIIHLQRRENFFN